MCATCVPAHHALLRWRFKHVRVSTAGMEESITGSAEFVFSYMGHLLVRWNHFSPHWQWLASIFGTFRIRNMLLIRSLLDPVPRVKDSPQLVSVSLLHPMATGDFARTSAHQSSRFRGARAEPPRFQGAPAEPLRFPGARAEPLQFPMASGDVAPDNVDARHRFRGI